MILNLLSKVQLLYFMTSKIPPLFSAPLRKKKNRCQLNKGTMPSPGLAFLFLLTNSSVASLDIFFVVKDVLLLTPALVTWLKHCLPPAPRFHNRLGPRGYEVSPVASGAVSPAAHTLSKR